MATFLRFKSRFWRRRHVILSALALSVLVIIAVNAFSTKEKEIQKKTILSHAPLVLPNREKTFIPNIRGVHLDLKGAPPKLEYFQKLFPLLRDLGSNAILLEYEDMFPFEGILQTARAHNAYTRADVRRLLSLAEKSSLHVIPLVQTFGHLEFALKLEEYSHLREVREMPQAICPSNNQSWTFIEAIIDQVMSLHPNVKYLHIGCDEVYHLGLCPLCRLKDRDTLFLNHVSRVAEYVVRSHHVIPIIWDDMLRQLSFDAIRDSKIAELGVQPMIWTYVKDIYRFVPESQFAAYSQLFSSIWGASAFKGAFGETLSIPNIRMHLENQISWLETLSQQSSNFRSISGIVVTGWQRYDHLAALCELLPSAIPSLALSLITLKTGSFKPEITFQQFDETLKCSQSGQHFAKEGERALQLIDESDPNLLSRASDCQFPGSDVFRLMRSHAETIKSVKDYLYDVTEHKAWLTLYNVRHNITSPFRIEEALQEFSSINYALSSLLRTAKDALSQVYDKFTVEEWIEQNIYPYLLKMERLMNDTISLKKARVWPKRPIRAPEELIKRLEF